VETNNFKPNTNNYKTKLDKDKNNTEPQYKIAQEANKFKDKKPVKYKNYKDN
jgi:hypothetical protein